MRCSECDEKIKDYYNFCKNCGLPLEEADFQEDEKAAVRGRRRGAAGMVTAVFLLFLAGIGSAVFLVYRMSTGVSGAGEQTAEQSEAETLPLFEETATTTTVTEITSTTVTEQTTTASAETETALPAEPGANTTVLPESVLRQIVSGKGNVALWEYADYDGDGLSEAFALTVMGETFFTHTIDEVYFIDAFGNLTKLYDPTAQSYSESRDGNRRSCGGKQFFWFDYSGITLVNNTLVYGVRNGQAYQLDVCGDLNGYYQDEQGTFYTTETQFDFSSGLHSAQYELLYDADAQQFRKGGRLNADTPPDPEPPTEYQLG